MSHSPHRTNVLLLVLAIAGLLVAGVFMYQHLTNAHLTNTRLTNTRVESADNSVTDNSVTEDPALSDSPRETVQAGKPITKPVQDPVQNSEQPSGAAISQNKPARIKATQVEPAPTEPAPTEPAAAPVVRRVVLLQSDATQDITFDDLAFEMEKDGEYDESMLTDKIRELAGKQIVIRGYMQPSFKQRGIKKFVFVRDNLECCFGPGAALYDCMIVKLKKGKSASFAVRPFAVKGKLTLDEFEGPDGKPWAIFQLSNAEIVE